MDAPLLEQMTRRTATKEDKSSGIKGIGLDTLNPISPDLSKFIPARLGYSPKVERISPKSNFSILSEYERLGDTIGDARLNHFRQATYNGTPRLISGEDLIKGKENLYPTVGRFKDVYKDVNDIVLYARKLYEQAAKDGDIWASMEMQDWEKITVQQWKYPGWFLQSMITSADVPNPLPDEAVRVAETVLKEYGRLLKLSGYDKKSDEELTLEDSDPQDTMTGMPTLCAGTMTHPARMALLAAAPSRGLTPEEWVSQYYALGMRLGFDPILWNSPIVSTRNGQMRKPLPLWQFLGPGAGYQALYECTGMYSRTRFVYPSPYADNFILSPTYVQCKHCRMLKPGFWHDPESQAKYIPMLRKQGRYTYSLDFSGMDTGMFPHIIMLFLRLLHKNGFSKWPLEAFMLMYPQMGIILPSYTGEMGHVTTVSGPTRPWASGFKMTSEMDTMYGASVVLTVLSQQNPGVIDEWLKGSFVFCELGDDVFFTSDFKYDPDKIKADALRFWGAKLEILEDCMFLKWYMPVRPEIPTLTRSMARFVQQTFFNEDRYTGVSGGDRPDALMRLALVSRCQGLRSHRDFDKFWPAICEAVMKLEYMKTAPGEFVTKFKAGEPELNKEDAAIIMDYTMKEQTYLKDLMVRADFEPSAAVLVRILKDLGMATDQTPADVGIRKQYWDAFMKRPTPSDVEALMRLTAPLIVY